MWRWADMSGTRGGDERKVSSLRELSPAIEPARDLWPQIEARINEGCTTAPGAMAAQPRPLRARAVPLRWLAAAAVVASVALGVWIGRSLLPAAPPGAGGESAAGASRRSRGGRRGRGGGPPPPPPPPPGGGVGGGGGPFGGPKQDLENALGKDPGNA